MYNFEIHQNGKESKRIADATIVKIELNSNRSPLLDTCISFPYTIEGTKARIVHVHAAFEKREKIEVRRIDKFTMNLDCKNKYEKSYLCIF